MKINFTLHNTISPLEFWLGKQKFETNIEFVLVPSSNATWESQKDAIKGL